MSLEINKIEPVYEDERGYIAEAFRGERGKQITVLYREAGSISGNHYHKGEDPSKDPERFLIIKGKLKLHAEDLEGETIADEIVDELTEIKVPANIRHIFEALEDTWFIEYRKTLFDEKNPDTYQ